MEDLGEFRELVTSAGVEPVAEVTGSRNQPSPRLFVGEGKLEEIRDMAAACEAASCDQRGWRAQRCQRAPVRACPGAARERALAASALALAASQPGQG